MSEMIINVFVKKGYVIKQMLKSIKLVGVLTLLLMTSGSYANALTSLEKFYATVNTLKAQFRQTVFDTDQQIIDQSRGVLYIARPGKFRWEYSSPLPQTIISDATKIWIHDIELEQVTVRNYQQTLAGTPAELLAGNGDLKNQYELVSIDDSSDNLQWLSLTPKADDTQFEEIRIGFKDNALVTMRLIDSFERTTQLIFDELEENASINLSLFSFDVPDNVDLIDNTASF